MTSDPDENKPAAEVKPKARKKKATAPVEAVASETASEDVKAEESAAAPAKPARKVAKKIVSTCTHLPCHCQHTLPNVFMPPCTQLLCVPTARLCSAVT